MGWDNGYYGHMNDWNYGYHGVFMGIIFLVFIGVIIWSVVKLTKSHEKVAPNSSSFSVPQKETPLEIIDRRLAQGEMSPEEYQKAKELLS